MHTRVCCASSTDGSTVPAIRKNTHNCSNRKWCRGNKHLETFSKSKTSRCACLRKVNPSQPHIPLLWREERFEIKSAVKGRFLHQRLHDRLAERHRAAQPVCSGEAEQLPEYGRGYISARCEGSIDQKSHVSHMSDGVPP